MTADESGTNAENPYGLTAREAEVVTLLVGGRTGTDVASLLHVDRRAVARYRAAAMAKLRASNGAQLAHLVSVAGLAGRLVDLEHLQSAFAG